MVAIPTPTMIGIRLKYTVVDCFSRKKIRVKITVNNGIVALTAKTNGKKHNKFIKQKNVFFFTFVDEMQ